MTARVLTVGFIFIASAIVGYNLISTTETVQAQPVVPSYLEMLSMMHSKQEAKQSAGIDTIEVSYDVNTQEVSVKGTADAIVNVTTTGELKPVVKWKTKVKEVNTGYPLISSMRRVTDNPIPPFAETKTKNE